MKVITIEEVADRVAWATAAGDRDKLIEVLKEWSESIIKCCAEIAQDTEIGDELFDNIYKVNDILI